MCSAIDNPASCETCTVIFLHTKNMSAAEICRELRAVYGQNVMSEGTVRQWCGMFKDGRTNVHDEERSGQPSVVSDDLVQSVDQKSRAEQLPSVYLPEELVGITALQQ
jgi:transposase